MAEPRSNQVLLTNTELAIIKAMRSIKTGSIEIILQEGGIHLVKRNVPWKPGTPENFPELRLT